MGHAWYREFFWDVAGGQDWGFVFNAGVYKVQARKCLLSVPREKEKLLLCR